MSKYFTEFVGTFFLVLIIGLSVANSPSIAPLAIGIGLVAIVYMGGHVSGAHYNPAVTLGVALRGKCPWTDVVPYWTAQLLGSAAAALVIYAVRNQTLEVKPGADYLAGKGLWMAVLVEVLFTFLLTLVILNVATCKRTAGNAYFGIAIGFTILAGAAAGGAISGGAYNPAVGVGPWLVNAIVTQIFDLSLVWIYLVGPFSGAILAAFAFRLQSPEDFQ